MIRLVAAALSITVLVAPGPAATEPAPCGPAPTRVAEAPPPLGETILARPTLRHVPKSPRGIIYVFHGSGGSEAFANRLHTRRVLGPLIAAGYGFAAAPSLDRTDVRRWRMDSLDPQVNPDVAYMLALHRTLVDRGEIKSTTPVFTMGMSNGGAFANLFAAAARTAGLPVTAVANYMGPFPAAMRSAPQAHPPVVPTLVVLGQTDGLVPPTPVAAIAARLSEQGARVEVHVAPERRICLADLAMADGVGAALADALLRERLPALGVLDAQGRRRMFLGDPLIDRADMAELGRALAPLGPQARDVANELLIAWGAHQMRSDYGARQLAFFEAALAARK